MTNVSQSATDGKNLSGTKSLSIVFLIQNKKTSSHQDVL